jgi:hypothetical protein
MLKKTRPREVVQSSPKSASLSNPLGDINEQSTPPTTQVPPSHSPQAPDQALCISIPSVQNGLPLYLEKSKVILTRLSKPCTTSDGKPGFLSNGSWMAMGFPCTGGEGRIDWKGNNYSSPKMVSFLLDTSCPMAPKTTEDLKTAVQNEAGVPPTMTLSAFNPFVIQYWEVTDYEDSDASFTVDLRVGKGLSAGWQSFIKQQPLKVFMVGRENAWVAGNFMYAVEAQLNWASKNRFTMNVIKARILKDEELAAVKSRCEALRPERECSKVFPK